MSNDVAANELANTSDTAAPLETIPEAWKTGEIGMVATCGPVEIVLP